MRRVSEIADMASLMCSGFIVKEGRPKEVGKYFKEKCLPCSTKLFPAKENKKEEKK